MKHEFDFFKVIHQNTKPQRGMALLAAPSLNDIYFKRSVVLITEHSEEGSVGFVLNKLLDISVAEMIDDFPSNKPHLMLGGPVDTDSLHFIHTLGALIPDSQHICHSVYWGGDFETIKQLFKDGKIHPSQIKFFVGKAGWSASQLNEELQEDSWVLVDLNETDIMSSDAGLWRTLVQRLGNDYRAWMNYPENPHLN